MGRSPCCDKDGLKKGPWTQEEDRKLLACIDQHGHGCWRSLPAKAGLQRCGKSCRLRWTNYLRPDIKRGKFSLQEEQTIIQLHALLGNRWSAIATHLPKRTDNEIKNYWNTHLKKRLSKMGIDPVTHKPSSDALAAGGGGAQRAKVAAHLSHTAQWESARLEAEARLAREAKLRELAASASAPLHHQPPPGGIQSPTSTLSFSKSAAALASVLAAMQPMHAFEEACNKDQTQHWGDVDAGDAGFVGEGFTGLLLDDGSLSQDLRPAERDDDAAEADAGLHEMEEEKNYWNSILNLVNTSSSASMSTSAVAPEAELGVLAGAGVLTGEP